jgi:hypothetical protein
MARCVLHSNTGNQRPRTDVRVQKIILCAIRPSSITTPAGDNRSFESLLSDMGGASAPYVFERRIHSEWVLNPRKADHSPASFLTGRRNRQAPLFRRGFRWEGVAQHLLLLAMARMGHVNRYWPSMPGTGVPDTLLSLLHTQSSQPRWCAHRIACKR